MGEGSEMTICFLHLEKKDFILNFPIHPWNYRNFELAVVVAGVISRVIYCFKAMLFSEMNRVKNTARL